MKKISLFFLSLLLLLNPISKVDAHDTDLYVASGIDIPPNVLIILDNSGSMNNEISGAVYDPNFEYPHVIVSYPNASYYKTKQGWNIWKNPYTDISCDAVKTALASQGSYRGKVVLGSSACGGSNEEIATGNYLNYLNSTGGPGNQPRFGLAKGIIHSYINTTDNVRFGLMIFNYQDGGKILYPVSDTWLSVHKTGIYQALSGLKADTWTPLSETLYEAGLYFQGKDSFFNPGIKYTSPVQYYCQKNYVILITDGEPTKDVADLPNNADQNPIKFNIGDYDNDGNEASRVYADQGSDYLDDVAKYLHGLDLSPQVTTKQQKQNITTYTVGFTWNSPLLQDTAKNSGGKYFYAHNAQSFVIALQNIIAEILSKSTSYVAPVVPISQMESTSAGNRMYLAMFKPTLKSFWKGNIKKFGIATQNSGNIKAGDVLDVSNLPAMEPVKDASNNVIGIKIKDDATSYWSSGPDGEDVEKGGVGEKLLNRSGARNIYTYLGTNTNLIDSSNAFKLTNSAITPQKLGLANNDDAGRDKVINFIHGLDDYDENGNGITNEKRDWILGAFIHSRPIVIHYENQSVIYAGANDGMFHAFDDTTGEELWGFIPPNLLSKLKNLNGEALEFFVDGAPKVYIEKDSAGKLVKVILLFGQRRGGNCYTALDVTIPGEPKYLWEISPSTTGYNELGQTWSTPLIGKIQYGGGEKWVAFIGGGFDENQDNDPVTADDTKGRAIYVVDILTGNLIWSYSKAKNVEMKYCIPSDIARVDTDSNGKIDRLYVGDTGGRVWRFDIGNSDTAFWTGKRIFNANAGSSDHRKIFYPPDVTLEKDSGNYEILFFGTGDREHPKKTVTWNRLYAIKDKNLSTVLSENDLEDVTADLLQDPNTPQSQKTSILNALSTKYGWYIKLDENIGEKALSNSVVFDGVVYYTTFTPSFGSQTDICFVGEGTSRLYALNYKTGNAVFNLDNSLDGGITRTDRSAIIGTAIPSGVIITFIGGKTTAYIGVGGGVYIPPLPSTKSLVPINWRIVF